MRLGGKDNGNGVARVLDSNGNVIVEIQNQGIVVDHGENGGVLVGNGSIFVRNANGKTVGIIHYQENGLSIQSYGGKFASVQLNQEGKVNINAVGDISISGNSVNMKGKTAKTGKAVFSDGTYLQFQDGVIVGGNTKEGAF